MGKVIYHGFGGRLGVIGKYSFINNAIFYLNFGSHAKVTNLQIGSHTSIGLEVGMLFNRTHDYLSITTSSSPLLIDRAWVTKRKGQIIIGNDVWIGNNVIIMSGVRVGDGAIIGAGAVIAKDVPCYAVVVGNPGRVIRYRYSQEQVRQLLQIRWWTWSDEKLAANRHYFSCPIEEFLKRFSVEEKERAVTSPRNRKKQFLFFPDFDDPFPLWMKVIEEFIKTFSSDDDVTLRLEINQKGDYSSFSNQITRFIRDVKVERQIPDSKLSDITIHNMQLQHDESIFRDVDCYIINRSIQTMRHIQYCDDYGVDTIAGVDIPAFCREEILR